jgi:hypothetical protein
MPIPATGTALIMGPSISPAKSGQLDVHDRRETGTSNFLPPAAKAQAWQAPFPLANVRTELEPYRPNNLPWAPLADLASFMPRPPWISGGIVRERVPPNLRANLVNLI